MNLFSPPIIVLYVCEARIHILAILLLFAYINISEFWIRVSSMYMWFKELGSLLADKRSGCLGFARVRGEWNPLALVQMLLIFLLIVLDILHGNNKYTSQK